MFICLLRNDGHGHHQEMSSCYVEAGEGTSLDGYAVCAPQGASVNAQGAERSAKHFDMLVEAELQHVDAAA